jgi:pimeloyl-ACP methyl ester carboxylesterase
MHFIEYKASKIRYQLEGNGDVILFIHGFLESNTIFSDIINELKTNYKCLAINLPGHGPSEGLNEDFEINDLAIIVNQILENKTIKKVKLIGHSLGTYVALEILNQFPEKVDGVCILHSTASADTPEKKANRNKAIELMKSDSTRFLTAFMPNLFAPQNKDKFKTEIKALMEQSQQIEVDNVVRMIKAMRDRKDHRKLLQKFNGSKHFIIGKEDPVISCTELVSQANETKANYTVLENVGHMGFVEDHKATLNAILAFLN